MKSKRTVLLVLAAAFIVSAKPVLAKGLENSTALSLSSSNIIVNKLSTISEKDKAKISQEQAKQAARNILKDYFETTIDDTKFQCNVNFNSYYMGKKISAWDIHWYNPNEDKQVNIDVVIDGTTGRVLRVDKFEVSRNQSSAAIATITQEEAKDIGETFLKRINPKEFAETTLVKDNNSVRYYGISSYGFIYNRTINKIPCESNNIRIGVDGITGKVTSYEITWDNDLKVPSSDKVIDQKAAEEIFDKNTKMKLRYNSYMEKPTSTQENKTKLVYTAGEASPIMIDAVNGKALTWNGDYMENVKTRNITDQQKEEILKNAKPIEKHNSTIGSDRAEQVIKDKIKDLFGDGYEINSVNYEENGYGYPGKDIKVWSGEFVKKGSNTDFGPPEGRISINALTEELVGIDKFNFNEKMDEKFEPKITWEQAYDAAITFIAKNCPQKIKEINTEQKDTSSQLYMYAGIPNRFITFNFGRVINGVGFNNSISYNNDGINITFDTKTGEMSSFSYLWQDKLDLPSVSNAISSDEAKKIFLNNSKPQLMYLLLNKGENMNKSDSKMQLVYTISNMNTPLNSVDAYTGSLLNVYGENIDDNIDVFKGKVKGSAVEKEAIILASQGIIDTKEFNLDARVTRLQLVKILVNAKGFNPYLKGMNDLSFTKGVGAKDSTDYKYVQLAVMYGIIQDKKEEFRGDELVTREEFSKSLIKLLGYDKIAEIKGLLYNSYVDGNTISADKAGYVSLAGGLKLIEASNDNKIRPKDNVTMSELIKAVYMALSDLQK